MTQSADLLLYGSDAKLLETRRMVLEREGYHISAITDPISTEPYLSKTPFDLLILCHTLSPDDCLRVLSLVRLRWPRISTLHLVRGASSRPETLLAAVADVLAQSSGSGSSVAQSAGSYTSDHVPGTSPQL